MSSNPCIYMDHRAADP